MRPRRREEGWPSPAGCWESAGSVARGRVSSCGVPPQVSGRPPCDSPQATAAREELHAQQARSLQEKDRLRRRVRELDEKADELQLQLFQREGQLLAVKGRLRRRLEIRVPVGLLGAGGLRPLAGAAGLPLRRGGPPGMGPAQPLTHWRPGGPLWA